MKKARDRRGISLIVLVITIIIMIIIAGAVILTLNGSGIITKSSLAKESSDFAAIKEAVELEKQNMLLTGTFDKNKIDIPKIYKDDIEITDKGEVLIKYNQNTKIIDMANVIKILGATYISNGFDKIQSISGETASAGETKLAKIIIEGKSEQSQATYSNNIIENGNFSNGTNGWNGFSGSPSLSVDNEELEISKVSGVNITIIRTTTTYSVTEGDKYYISYYAKTTGAAAFDSYFRNNTASISNFVPSPTINLTSNYQKISGIMTINSSFNNSYVCFRIQGSDASKVYLKDVMVINLTKEFGAGNEPTKQQCDSMYSTWFNGTIKVGNIAGFLNSPRPEYPSEIKSVEDFDLVSAGKNLFDINRFNNKAIAWNGQNGRILNYKLKPNTTYTLSSNVPGDISGSSSNRHIYLNSSTSTSAVFNGHSVNITTNSSGEFFIGIITNRPYSNDILNGVYWIQLEEGSVATNYEPSKENTINFAYEIDNINKTAKLYRNIGEKVFNGTENWQVADVGVYRITAGILSTVDREAYSSHFKVVKSYTYNHGELVFNSVETNMFPIFTNKNCSTLTEWKEWLASQHSNGTPITVQYKLATPIVTELPYQELQLEYPATNIYTTSNVKPKIIGQIINK